MGSAAKNLLCYRILIIFIYGVCSQESSMLQNTDHFYSWGLQPRIFYATEYWSFLFMGSAAKNLLCYRILIIFIHGVCSHESSMLQNTHHFYSWGLQPRIFFATEYWSFLFMGSAAKNLLCYRILIIFIHGVCSQESSMLQNTHHFYSWGLQPRIFYATEYWSFLFMGSAAKNLLCYRILIIFIYGVCSQESSMLQNTDHFYLWGLQPRIFYATEYSSFLFMGSAAKNLLCYRILIIFIHGVCSQESSMLQNTDHFYLWGLQPRIFYATEYSSFLFMGSAAKNLLCYRIPIIFIHGVCSQESSMLQNTDHFYLWGLQPRIFYATEYWSFLFMGSAAKNLLCYRILIIFIYGVCSQESSMLQNTHHFYLWGLQPRIFYATEYWSFLFMGSAAKNLLCYRILIIFIYGVCSQESSMLQNTHHFYLWGLQPRIFYATEYPSFLFMGSAAKNLLCYRILIIFIYGVCSQESSMLQNTDHFYLWGLQPRIFYATEYWSFLFMGSAAKNLLCYRILIIFIYGVCSQESSMLQNTHHFYSWGLQPRIFYATEYWSFLFMGSAAKNLLCYRILIIFIYGVCSQESSMLQNTDHFYSWGLQPRIFYATEYPSFLFMGSAAKNLLCYRILIIFIYGVCSQESSMLQNTDHFYLWGLQPRIFYATEYWSFLFMGSAAKNLLCYRILIIFIYGVCSQESSMLQNTDHFYSWGLQPRIFYATDYSLFLSMGSAAKNLLCYRILIIFIYGVCSQESSMLQNTDHFYSWGLQPRIFYATDYSLFLSMGSAAKNLLCYRILIIFIYGVCSQESSMLQNTDHFYLWGLQPRIFYATEYWSFLFMGSAAKNLFCYRILIIFIYGVCSQESSMLQDTHHFYLWGLQPTIFYVTALTWYKFIVSIKWRIIITEIHNTLKLFKIFYIMCRIILLVNACLAS